MNQIPYWVSQADPASWALLNLIGQTTTLPFTVLAGGTSTQVLHGHTSLPYYGPVILTADVTGILPLENGGTNASTASSAAFNLGVSSMGFQASSNIAVTGGSISSLTFLSTTALSTGTLRALTNVSTATVSSASIFAATQVSSALLRVVTNVSSATVSTGNLFAYGGTISSMVVNATAIGPATASTGAFTTLSTSTLALAITSLVVNLNADMLDGQHGVYYTAVSNHVYQVKTISVADSPYTVVASDYYIRATCSSGNVTVLFPHASSRVRTVYVKKLDSTISTVTISSVATDTFDGAVTTALASQYATKGFISAVTGSWERLTTPTI